MEIKEKKKVVRYEDVTIARKCDVCGNIHNGKHTPDEWHCFSSSHNEWGNDSIDSFEQHEVCSPKCYWVKMKQCVNDLDGYNDAEIDSFEIQFARRLVVNYEMFYNKSLLD